MTRSVQLKRFYFRSRGPSLTVPGADRRVSSIRGPWVVSSAESGSGGPPFVPVMKAADLWDRNDAAIAARGDRAGNGSVLVQR
jgi:hypothetical protein